MADRKVLNKYYPPDFDPDKLARSKRLAKTAGQRAKDKKQKGGSKIMNVRMMFPFTLCCASCKEFVYVGTKFNSRVEKVQGEDYLGIIIWRFYGRCPNCRAEIAFKTDPKNGDYVLESGGTRTYDASRDQERAEKALKEKEAEALEGDRMKQIESKRYDTRQELQSLEQLEELRRMNSRLMDRAAASNAALEFLQAAAIAEDAAEKLPGDQAKQQDEQDQKELVAFRAAVELQNRDSGQNLL
eukprot:GHVT01005022.1.p1 GENE.GHVT01005022.1~~GHVT01005022.1.p1  ORF type:complete len:242 (+),score=44.24 GHVT01005022.1:875-1600(+)